MPFFLKGRSPQWRFHSAGIREGVCIEVPWLFDQENSIDLIRVQDSRRADLGLPSTYRCKIRSEVKCLTRPEIEMLVIIAEERYEDCQKRRMKPSIYCKDVLGLPEVKNYGFFRNRFSDIDLLLKTIKRYDELFPSRVVGEMSLYDLLNEDARRRIQKSS